MTLLLYRLRPVPWLILIVFSGICVAVTVTLGPTLGSKGMLYTVDGAGLLLGIGGALVVSPQIDPPQVLLETTPRPFWRTPFIRLCAWLIVAIPEMCYVAWKLNGRWEFHASELRWAGLLALTLSLSMSFVMAVMLGSYFGGGIGLGTVAFFSLASVSWRGFPLRVLDSPRSQTFQNGRVWVLTAAGAFCLIGVARLKLGSWITYWPRAKATPPPTEGTTHGMKGNPGVASVPGRNASNLDRGEDDG